MDARTEQPPAGWVTVAAAAAALTRSGDPIDASNVSRYLARYPEVASMKLGKFRYVDAQALADHRGSNVLVSEKRGARDIPEPTAALPLPGPVPAVGIDVDEDDDDVVEAAPRDGRITDANLRLKLLKIREAERAEAEAEGRLVQSDEVLALISGVVQTFVSELEREETTITLRHGRDMGIAFRQGRKRAQAAAATQLTALAHKHLPARLLPQLAAQPVTAPAKA